MNEPVKRTPEEIYRDAVGECAKNLFDKVIEVAQKQVTLETVRVDRALPPESIQDAAISYRKAEGEALDLLNKLTNVHAEEVRRHS